MKMEKTILKSHRTFTGRKLTLSQTDIYNDDNTRMCEILDFGKDEGITVNFFENNIERKSVYKCSFESKQSALSACEIYFNSPQDIINNISI